MPEPKFTKTEISDHAFAAYLRRHGAIDNYCVGSNKINHWYSDKAQTNRVAFATYGGKNGMCDGIHLRYPMNSNEKDICQARMTR